MNNEKFINKVFNYDCLKFMKDMPSNFINCTITSPPYNKGEQGAILVPKIKYDSFKDNIAEKQYQQKQIETLNEIYRITKFGGSCLYNHKPRWNKGKSIYPFSWINKTNWEIRQMIIWNRKITGNLRAF